MYKLERMGDSDTLTTAQVLPVITQKNAVVRGNSEMVAQLTGQGVQNKHYMFLFWTLV